MFLFAPETFITLFGVNVYCRDTRGEVNKRFQAQNLFRPGFCFIVFIDFKVVYDSIVRVKLYEGMSSFEIPTKLIKLVRMTMTNVQLAR